MNFSVEWLSGITVGRIREIKSWVSVFFLSCFGFDTLSRATVHHIAGLVKMGSDYGGWITPMHLLRSTSICYCAGVGEDITFDLGLIEKLGCHVFAFDPTPRAKIHVKKTAVNIERYHFFDYGLWDNDEMVRFFAPRDPLHVSHSALNLQKTEHFFDAPCKRLSTIMRENGHDHIDLLKLDIEGAEYVVLRSILEDQLQVGIICVEYDELHNAIDDRYMQRIRGSIAELREAGYVIVAKDAQLNYTFVKREWIGSMQNKLLIPNTFNRKAIPIS
jgi:FkbM family methyltransferase